MRHKYAGVILTATAMLGSLLFGFILGSVQEVILIASVMLVSLIIGYILGSVQKDTENSANSPKPRMGFRTPMSINAISRMSDED